MAKSLAIRDIVESIARVPDHVLRALYIQQCSKRLGIGEQALISEMNKVLRRQYRKKLGGDQVPEEALEPSTQPVQPELEELGTRPQEKELLRLLINYGHVAVTHLYSEFKEDAEPRALTVGEWIYTELEEDEMKIYDALVQTALFDHRDAFAQEAKERLTYFLAHPDGDLRKLVMELSTEPHVLADWKRHRIHVHQEDHDLQTTVKKALRRYKERYVDQLLTEKLDAIRLAGSTEMEGLMREKMSLEKLRKLLAEDSGRVTVG
jgi:DNA primase